MRSKLPHSEVTLRADSLFCLKLAAEAGLGLAALPCYLGETSPALVCVHAPIEAMETDLWILTHDDLRHTARIRAFTEFTAAAFARRRALLEGESARPRSKRK
jgi:DNA-binding transcriptional LysR family regulator